MQHRQYSLKVFPVIKDPLELRKEPLVCLTMENPNLKQGKSSQQNNLS